MSSKTETAVSVSDMGQLAINGGTPVRSHPLPWELPGAHWIGEEERQLIERVVLARSPFRFYGPDLQGMVNTLEAEWKTTFGHPYVLAVSSATAALTIALSALDIGPGDEVIVPGYMWVSCISAIVRTGAIPRLADIDDTFCLDPDDFESKIGPHTRAVLYVHMSGAPGHIDRVAAICQARGLFLIEDCAQAAGGSFQGLPVGHYGDIGTYSFQLNKNMTSGDGGLLVCKDETIYRRLVALHDLGYPRTPAGRLDTSDPDVQLWGMGARMNELSGAMALAQMRKLGQITGAMRTAKWQIRTALEGTPGLVFRRIVDPQGDTGPFLLMLLPDEDKAARFVAALRAEGMVGPQGSLACLTLREWGMHWYSNIPSLVNRRSNSRDGYPWTHPANAFADNYDYHAGVLPRCDDYQSRGALLTVASCLEQTDVDDIIAALRKVTAGILS